VGMSIAAAAAASVAGIERPCFVCGALAEVVEPQRCLLWALSVSGRSYVLKGRDASMESRKTLSWLAYHVNLPATLTRALPPSARVDRHQCSNPRCKMTMAQPREEEAR
jgi:hypothetical protein